MFNNIFLVKGVFLIDGVESTEYRLVYGNDKDHAEAQFRYTFSGVEIVTVEVTGVININLP
jgi:hypothetical protein